MKRAKPSDYLREAREFYEMGNGTDMSNELQAVCIAKAQAAASIGQLMLTLPRSAFKGRDWMS